MANDTRGAKRQPILRLNGNRVEILASVILGLLWEHRAEAVELGGLDTNSAVPTVLAGEAELVHAIATNANPAISLDDLVRLMDPPELIRLGLDPADFAALLQADPERAIRALDAAFHGKLKLVAAHADQKVVAHAGGPSNATAAREIASDADLDGGGKGGGGNGILYALGGLLGAGAAAGAAAGGSGGGAMPLVSAPAVNAVPVAVADSVGTPEDNAVTFDVRSNDNDANGDALLVTAINGVAITTTTPVSVAGGIVSLGSDGRLTFTPAANFNGPISLTYAISDGHGASATGAVSLNVAAVNDAPVNTGPTAAIGAASATTVGISGLAIADVDGSAGLTTRLVVSHGVLFAASVTGGATITGSGTGIVELGGTLAQINATLAAITYRSDAGYAGGDTLTIVTSDGTTSDTDSFAITVTAVQSGVLSDGYVAGGTVFIDVNGNGQLDPGEPNAQTDGTGHFSLGTDATGTLIAFGGINTDTGLPNLITMRAPVGATVINPLTTIVSSLIAGGMSEAAANAAVAGAFGLPAGIDFGNFDILAASDNALGLAAQKAATSIATLLTLGRGAADPGHADTVEAMVLARIADALAGHVPIADLASLRLLFGDIPGLSASAVDSLAATGAATLAAIDAATSIAGLGETVQDFHGNLHAVDDVASATINTPVTFDVRGNDSNPDGTPLTVVAIGSHALSLGVPVAVAGGEVSLNADGTLTFSPSTAFAGTQHLTYTVTDGHGGFASAAVAIDVTAGSPTLHVAAADIGLYADHAGALATAGVTTLDLNEDGGHLSEVQANAFIGAGLDFADADHVTLDAQGTHLSTTLKGLQALHIDAVAVHAGIAGLGAIAGTSLGDLSAHGLPSFAVTRSDASLDVTLAVDSGTVAPGADLAHLAPALAIAGIDHLAADHLALSTGQLGIITAADLDFTPHSDITLLVGASEFTEVAAHAAALATAGVDHLDVTGGAITISDTEASALVGAGLDFAAADHVTLAAEGTHLSTSLKGPQDLKVDAVTAGHGVATLSLSAGPAGLGALAVGGLPSFAGGVDVTVTQAAGTLDPHVDLSRLAPGLAAAGIDHIGVDGDGALSLTFAQAHALATAGIDFVPAATITVALATSDVGTAVGLGAAHVDHLDMIGDHVSLSDNEAGQLIAAGLDFAEADAVNVEAHGTHLSTTLQGLQTLHVDSVQVEPGIHNLVVAAGDLTAITDTGVPLLDTSLHQSLDVTLAVSATDLGELPRLAAALRDAGVDHIALDQPLGSFDEATTALLGGVTAATGIDFVYLPPVEPMAFASLMSELQGDGPTLAPVVLTDAAAAALVESGALGGYLSDVVTVDATAAGDRPVTTLHTIVELGVDIVQLADQHDQPVYIDLGLAGSGTAVAELQSLFATLDGSGYQRIFSGSEHVALVVDAAGADALAGIDGALDHLAQIGFTQIDVLGATTTLASFGPVEVKLIGEDDQLYDYLHAHKA